MKSRPRVALGVALEPPQKLTLRKGPLAAEESMTSAPATAPPAWLVELGDRVAAHPQLLAHLPTSLSQLPFASNAPAASFSKPASPAASVTENTAADGGFATTSAAPSSLPAPTPSLPPPAADASWADYQRWIHDQIRLAVKALFDAGVATESQARPAIQAYLLAAAGHGTPTHMTRSSTAAHENGGIDPNKGSSNNKRKRSLNSDEDETNDDEEVSDSSDAHPLTVHPAALLPPPTPVMELYVPPPPEDQNGWGGNAALAESTEAAQLWTQLELRHAGLDGVCERAVQMEQKEEDEEAEDARVSSAQLTKAEHDGDDDDEDEDEDSENDDGSGEEATEEDLASLAAMTDAQMKAIGFAPREIVKVRTELRKRGYSQDASGASSPTQEAQLEENEMFDDDDLSDDEFGYGMPGEEEDEGFPGASDLSDDDEASRVFIEPLQEEEDQLRRKDLFGTVSIDDSDSEDESDEEEVQNRDSDKSQDAPLSSSTRPSSSLDDGFFNLEAFQRDTIAAEQKDPEGDIDLFADPATWTTGDDEENDDTDTVMYHQFFLPPNPSAKLQGQSKGKAASQQDTGKTKSDDSQDISTSASTAGRGKIRFLDQVQVRRIKRAPSMRDSGSGQITLPSALETPDELDSEGDDEASDAGDAASSSDEDENQADSENDAMHWEDPSEDGQSDGVDEDDALSSGDEKSSDREDASIEGTARRVAQDLFAEDDAATATDDRSTHEKRQTALQEEIAALEAENVAPKDWELGGEATASVRPKDAALDMDMDFVHSLQSAPLATTEHNEDIDDLIRRRIFANEWDDVARRVALGDEKEFLPSKLASLSDQKSQQSLAELYEQEYTQAQAGGAATAPMSEADAKLAAEHAELSALVENVFAQLDQLSNAHYTPRPPDVHAGTVGPAPSGGVAAMASEQALPEVATSAQTTLQTPKEVYDPSSRTGTGKGTRVSHSFTGTRDELTPEEKKKEHNRLRRLKKARPTGSGLPGNSGGTSRPGARGGGAKAEKEAALRSLVSQSGVSLVGADGQRNTMVNKRGSLERAKAPAPPEGGKLKL